MMQLDRVMISNEDQIKFLYDVRTSPEVCAMLTQDPPSSYEQHKAWLYSKLIPREYATHDHQVREIFILSNNGLMTGYFQLYGFSGYSCEVGYAVHPSYFGRGFGNALVDASVKKGAEYGMEFMRLYVKGENHKAIHLYSKHGFALRAVKDNGEVMMIRRF